MKKVLFSIFLSILFISNSFAANGDIALPTPKQSGGMPLMDVLSKRHADRSFSGKEFDNQTVSNILWAAFGINREDGRRTIPTARNQQNLFVYALLPNGAFLYNAKDNKLEQISTEDFRAKSGRQEEILGKAGMVLVYVEKIGDANNRFNTGAAAQNVGLYAASAGLNNVVIGMANYKELAELFKLPKNMQVQVIQAVGNR